MSDALHLTRLWWVAAWGRGGGVHDGVTWALTQRPPVLLALGRLIEIEYSPLTGIYRVQQATGAREDMRDVHRAECLAYLRHVAAGTHGLATDWQPDSWRGER